MTSALKQRISLAGPLLAVAALWGTTGTDCLGQQGLFLLDVASLQGSAPEWDIIDPIDPSIDGKLCSFLGDNAVPCTVFNLTDQAGGDNNVTLEVLGVGWPGGYLPNNPAPLTEPQVWDGIDVPLEAFGDYHYRNPDTAGSSGLWRFNNLNPGSYRVTVFEGRTTDGNGQFAKLWVGDANGSNEPGEAGEHEGANTEDFAAGHSTLTVNIAEGETLWYRHLEDNSGGISGFIIRPDNDERLPRRVNGDDFGTLMLPGFLGNKVLSDVGPTSGLAQYWFEGNLAGDIETVRDLGTTGSDTNPLINKDGKAIASPTTWWAGSGTLTAGGVALPRYPVELAESRFERANNADNYTVRLVGELFVPANGDYLFRDGNDDLAMVAVDLNGNGDLDELDVIVNDDLNTGGGFDDVLILDTEPATVDGGSQPLNGYAEFSGIDAGGEWRRIEMWMSEGGGGDGGTLYMAAENDPDLWDDILEDPLTQAQIDKFLIGNDRLRGTAATLVSADLVASPSNKAVFEYVVQVGADGHDQIAVAASGGDIKRVLDMSNTTVRIEAVGNLTSGAEFQIFGADQVNGLDSLTMLFADASQWDLSQLATGVLVFGAASSGLLGDIDRNGSVDFPDFLVLSANFGTNVPANTAGDLDGDGNVGFPDFLILSANFGRSGAAAAVPEPTSLALLNTAGLLLLGMLRRRRR